MATSVDFSAAALSERARAEASRALAEDVGAGDLTAGLIDPGRRARARVLAREAAVICGAPWVEATVRQLEPAAAIRWLVSEGGRSTADQVVLEVEGSARALLTAERTALNFLQLLSGVATRTAVFVEAVRGTRAQIVDTRKTLPGLRLAQKYAVRTGGGTNHRIGLYDAILIKDNHIAGLGDPATAVRRSVELARAFPGNAGLPVEVEVDSLDQLRQVLSVQPEIVLLDNMTNEQLRAAVARRNAVAPGVLLEASGGVNLTTVRGIAETGVERISVGALTHSATALDIALDYDA